MAYETLLALHQQGLAARLIVCGCTPPPACQHPGLEAIPLLDKNRAAGYEQLSRLLATVHFLLLPTRADCSLLVAMEANAYGVPALTTRVGGVPDVVLDGVNGYCLPLAAEGPAYAATIATLYTDQPLVKSSWQSWPAQFEQALQRRQLYASEALG